MTTNEPSPESEPFPRDPREGVFDEQLSFPVPFTEAPTAIKTITKRDGREAPFERRKIAEAIYQAAQSLGVGDRDRAESLASAVTLYLAKQLNGGTAAVDQVHDAVERVLIELGHGRTALAYARYRDRRQRLRKLREGDVQAVVEETEAAEQREAGHAGEGLSLFVRTSDERLMTWERGRIVEALVRETALDEATAEIIAREVEQQILDAQVAALTAPLIRELVGAKLIEHGLEKHYRRHMRLGVPLFDAEKIICVSNEAGGHAHADPATSDAILAGRVKKEFALAQVFSQPVADAHLGGAVHLHGLDTVDRFAAGGHGLDFVQRFGVRSIEGHPPGGQPAHAMDLVAQTAAFTAGLERHFAGETVWDAFNVHFAPFIAERPESESEYAAHALLAEFAHRCGPSTVLGLRWTTPDGMRKSEAIGPGGAYAGEIHAAFESAAQRFMLNLLDGAWRGPTGFTPFQAPRLEFVADARFFRAPGREGCLARIASAILGGAPVRIRFEREADATGQGLLAHAVTLNLPRAAAATEEPFFRRLGRLVDLAVQAHEEKRAFLSRLMAWKDLGPLGFLAREWDGAPYADPESARYAVRVLGLDACARLILQEPLHGEEALDMGRRIVEHLAGLLAEKSQQSSLDLVLGLTEDLECRQRLAKQDLVQGSEGLRQTLSGMAEDASIAYPPGARLAEDAPVSPMERVRLEGSLHAALSEPAFVTVNLPSDDMEPAALATFIEKAFHQSAAKGLRFAVSKTAGGR